MIFHQYPSSSLVCRIWSNDSVFAMNRPLSRRQTFRQSLSDHAKSSLPSLVRSSTIFFDSKKENWPEPEKSIGRPCELLFKNTECWEVVGPVLDIFNKIAPAIDKLIEDNQELLEQGEPKSRGISFAMWMEGSKPSSARPVIVFCSRSRRQRSYAKALLKESSILDKHPGVSIKALDKMPAIRHAQSLKSHLSSSAASRLDIFMTDPSSEPFGAQITFGDSEAATMLGMVYLNGKQHALIPQHPRFDHYDEELDVLPDKEELLEFDEDSDMDETVLIEITSNGKLLRIIRWQRVLFEHNTSFYSTPFLDMTGSKRALLKLLSSQLSFSNVQ